MKEETLQPIPQKFKRLKEITIDNHTQKNWWSRIKDKFLEMWNILRINLEERKYEQMNNEQGDWISKQSFPILKSPG